MDILVTEASEISGYNQEHLRRLLREGKIKGTKIATIWTVDRDSLMEYVNDAKDNKDRRWKKG